MYHFVMHSQRPSIETYCIAHRALFSDVNILIIFVEPLLSINTLSRNLSYFSLLITFLYFQFRTIQIIADAKNKESPLRIVIKDMA